MLNFEVSDFADIEDEVMRRLDYEDYPSELDSFQAMVLRYEIKALENPRFTHSKESSVVTIDEQGKRHKKHVHIECTPQEDMILGYIQKQLHGSRYAPSKEGLRQILNYYINSVFYVCEINDLPSPNINRK